MIRLLFLTSGEGGNLKFLREYFNENEMSVAGVFTDRDCGAMKYAKAQGIKTYKPSFSTNPIEEQNLLDKIIEVEPDLIINGVHKPLNHGIISKFKNSIISLHYSFMPAYSDSLGMRPVQEAIDNNTPFIITSVYKYEPASKNFRIITQGMFRRFCFDDIYQKAFECGALTLLTTIYQLENKTNQKMKLYNKIFLSHTTDLLDLNRTERIFNLLKESNNPF